MLISIGNKYSQMLPKGQNPVFYSSLELNLAKIEFTRSFSSIHAEHSVQFSNEFDELDLCET